MPCVTWLASSTKTLYVYYRYVLFPFFAISFTKCSDPLVSAMLVHRLILFCLNM